MATVKSSVHDGNCSALYNAMSSKIHANVFRQDAAETMDSPEFNVGLSGAYRIPER